MSIEIFTKEQFESALPLHKEKNEPVWEYVGVKAGEHCYQISINEDIRIFIRSSVHTDGLSADTGQDSIRCWLIDSEGKPLGSKIQKYITRIPKWNERLINTLRELWERAKSSGYCEKCGSPNHMFKVKKNGPNKNRLFSKCPNCENSFEWLT